MSPRIRLLLRIAVIIFAAAVAVHLVRTLREHGDDALELWRGSSIRYGWIAAAVGAALAGHGFTVVGWRRLLRDCSVDTSFMQVTRLFLISNLGRYLPGGKAWQLGAVAALAKEGGLPVAIVTATSLLQGIVGLAVGALLLLALGASLIGMSTLWLLPVAMAVLGIVASPRLLREIPRMRALVLLRVPVAEHVDSRTMWAVTWTAAAGWVAWGIGLYCLARGFGFGADASVIRYVAAWIGPFLGGLIFFMTPAGLGAREDLMINMLRAENSAAMATLVTVIARIWNTILDVVPAAIVLLVHREGQNRTAEQ